MNKYYHNYGLTVIGAHRQLGAGVLPGETPSRPSAWAFVYFLAPYRDGGE